MPAIARYFIALMVALCCYKGTTAQICVSFLSRTDSFAFLGTGSDNRVRIHNIPPGAVVSIYPGAAVHVKDDEYVLCRFGACIEKGCSAVLKITVDNKTIFSKNYKLLPTAISGSVYHPLLHVALGHNNTHSQGNSIDTMSAWEFTRAVRANDLFIAEDTSIRIIGLELSIKATGKDFAGPYRIGKSYLSCGTLADLSHSTPADTTSNNQNTEWVFRHEFNSGTMGFHSLNVASLVFFECIAAVGKNGGIYTAASKIIYIQ